MLVQAKSSLVFPALSVQNPAFRSFYFILISTLKLLQVFASKTCTSMMICKITDKSPFNDCYVMVEYKYWYENILLEDRTLNLVSHQAQLRLFLESLYHKNEHAFQVKLCFLRAAFSKVCTGKMIFEIGAGGRWKRHGSLSGKELARLTSNHYTGLRCLP